MEQISAQCTIEENFFISAINQEIFNRVFPHIRHDLVGYITTSLMRISIIDRYMNKFGLEPDQVKADLKKIDGQLRDAIVGIRELHFWDFDSAHEDYPSKIAKKSQQLMATQLAMKNIQVSIVPEDIEENVRIKTKPLLYCLLCVFCYFEDNNLIHNNLTIHISAKSIEMVSVPIATYDLSAISKKRNLMINQEIAKKFAALYKINLIFNPDRIHLAWE